MRRSATVIKHKGAGPEIIVGPPKSGRPRTLDVDPGTLAALKAHKAAQGMISLALARDVAYVLANINGELRHPDGFSKRFVSAVVAARKGLGEEVLSRIRLHDLRHAHATLLLAAGIPVKSSLSGSATRMR